ncbi:MAG: hypothetical protein KY461_14845 [Actinobacteria bacterium]|nr:hypothetical protein [Actinomycetota bacterium]
MTSDPEDARPAWLAVDDLPPVDATPTRPRGPWLFAAAAIPWLVVVALLVRPTGPTPDAAVPATFPSPTETPTPTDAAAGEVGGAPGASDDGDLRATITSSGALVAVDEDEARAVAVVAARRWLTTVGPGAADPGTSSDAVYAEHLVVEGVDHPAPGAAVVTVRAVVLRIEGGDYGATEVRRVAVPLRFDAGGASPAGTPYALPVDDPSLVPIETTEAIEDPDLLLVAGEALAAAGYRDISVVALHRTSSWPLVVTADASVDDGPARRLAVWLRPHLGRLVVAGTRPRPAPTASPSPSEIPSSPDAGETAGADPTHEHEEVAP